MGTELISSAATGNGLAREGFGERSLEKTGERATAALQAAATAQVQARFVVAAQHRRSWLDVRARLLEDCKRPGFAKAARYLKPIGEGIRGPSIRFAEACLRYAGNLDLDTTTTFEDEEKRILKVRVIDYETNTSASGDVVIDKTVERRSSVDRVVLSQRTNKRGDQVFIVAATDDELLNKVNALVSKAARVLILRLIPADLVEEGQAVCIQTMSDDAAKDPTGGRKRLSDAFAAIGIMPADLAIYLGHPVENISPAEIVELSEILTALREGDTTWKAVLEGRASSAAKDADVPKKPTAAEKIRQRTANSKGAPRSPHPLDRDVKPKNTSPAAPATEAIDTRPRDSAGNVEEPPAQDGR